MKNKNDIENSLTINLRALLIGEKVTLLNNYCYLSKYGHHIINDVKYINFYDVCEMEFDVPSYKIVVELLTTKGNKTKNYEKELIL